MTDQQPNTAPADITGHPPTDDKAAARGSREPAPDVDPSEEDGVGEPVIGIRNVNHDAVERAGATIKEPAHPKQT